MTPAAGRDSLTLRRLGISAAVAAILLLLLAAAGGSIAGAASCGGGIVCQCGDTVTSDYEMTSDLGPCPRLPVGDTVGLRVAPGVILDCKGNTVAGPGDVAKDSF